MNNYGESATINPIEFDGVENANVLRL